MSVWPIEASTLISLTCITLQDPSTHCTASGEGFGGKTLQKIAAPSIYLTADLT